MTQNDLKGYEQETFVQLMNLCNNQYHCTVFFRNVVLVFSFV